MPVPQVSCSDDEILGMGDMAVSLYSDVAGPAGKRDDEATGLGRGGEKHSQMRPVAEGKIQDLLLRALIGRRILRRNRGHRSLGVILAEGGAGEKKAGRQEGGHAGSFYEHCSSHDCRVRLGRSADDWNLSTTQSMKTRTRGDICRLCGKEGIPAKGRVGRSSKSRPGHRSGDRALRGSAGSG